MDALFTSSGLVALVTLTFLEIVLGVDNVIFISILSSKLPASQQDRARRIGLLAAMGMRILLLLSIVWIIKLTAPLFVVLGRPISGRDLILMGGGLFLLAKATIEIHDRLEGEEGHSTARVRPSFAGVITQIAMLDIVFSLDSVITAVGMAEEISIMVAAVILAVGVSACSSDRGYYANCVDPATGRVVDPADCDRYPNYYIWMAPQSYNRGYAVPVSARSGAGWFRSSDSLARMTAGLPSTGHLPRGFRVSSGGGGFDGAHFSGGGHGGGEGGHGSGGG